MDVLSAFDSGLTSKEDFIPHLVPSIVLALKKCQFVLTCIMLQCACSRTYVNFTVISPFLSNTGRKVNAAHPFYGYPSRASFACTEWAIVRNNYDSLINSVFASTVVVEM